jgi:D-alanine-D-alanine ligase
MSRVRIVVLYNTDYDSEVDNPDAAAVRESAVAIVEALRTCDFAAELVGLHGTDVHEVLVKIAADKPDLLFNLCESMDGIPANEPTFAGLLDLFKIPYTGADLLALASCLHKHRTKDILIANNVPTPAYRHLRAERELEDAALDRLEYPMFVKLEHEDASLGITEANVCRTAAALRTRARELMRAHGQGVIAERYIEGREVNVTLLGYGDNVEILPLHEIDFAAMPADRPHIVSYAAKWDANHVDYIGTKPVPLRDVSPATRAEIERVARGAWRALGLRDYGRVDLRVDAKGVPWVIDVNPNPDISPDAGVARAGAAAGLSYPRLIGRIAELALARIRRTAPHAAT